MTGTGTVRNGRRAWGVALAALVLGGAAACERAVTSAPGEPLANTAANGSGAIAGRVLDLSGAPVAGAVVRTPGGAAAVSGGGGEFALGGLPAAERLAVTVSAEGYATGTAIYRVIGGATVSREIRLARRGPRVLLDAAAGGVVQFAGGGRVSFPPNAFAGVAPGEQVSVQVTYFDPESDAQLSAAPGDFSGVEADGSPSQLETAGMVEVFVTNSQNAQVSLAPGQRATISFPDRDGPATRTWGLYRFDTATGTWVRTGDAPAEREGTQRADVPSVDRPWNVDLPLETSCITVRVQDTFSTPRIGEPVTAQGANWRGPSSGMTDAKGSVDLLVRASSPVDVSAGPVTQNVFSPPAGTPCGVVVVTLVF